jgi:hypothetical protein
MSINDKLNLYFDKNPTLDKNMVITSLELLIKGNNVDYTNVKILKETGFFDIVYNINSPNLKKTKIKVKSKIEQKNIINEIDLFKIRSKINKIFELLSIKNQISLFNFHSIFNKKYNKITDKNIQLNFEEYNEMITNKIFDICEDKISSKKGKFNHSQEIFNYLDKLIFELNEKRSYLKEDSSKQIENILGELQIDANILNTIDLNDKESIDLIKSVYHDSEIIQLEDTPRNDELLELKNKFQQIYTEYNKSTTSINGLVDNSKKLENHIITILNKVSKLEENDIKYNDKITTLENKGSEKSKIQYEYIFKDIDNGLKNIKDDMNTLDTKTTTSVKEVDIMKSRISILDSDYSKHKECVVNSFEVIEERLTQLFKSMIIVNNNIKHCYSNTEKMYSEIVNKIKN